MLLKGFRLDVLQEIIKMTQLAPQKFSAQLLLSSIKVNVCRFKILVERYFCNEVYLQWLY